MTVSSRRIGEAAERSDHHDVSFSSFPVTVMGGFGRHRRIATQLAAG